MYEFLNKHTFISNVIGSRLITKYRTLQIHQICYVRIEYMFTYFNVKNVAQFNFGDCPK